MGEGESGLAPQEVYSVAKDLKGKKGKGGDDEGVVVTSGGTVIGRAELTREQKRRNRNREKARAKKKERNLTSEGKAGSAVDATGDGKGKETRPAKGAGKGAQERNKILNELQKGDVKVIGKGGELTNVLGRAAAVGDGKRKGGGGLKL